jgi:hypothetical protein
VNKIRKYILAHLALVLLLLTACNSATSLTIPESILVIPTDTAVKVASGQQYMAVASYADGRTANITDEVTWSSIDFAVANIDSLGFARAKAEGTTTVVAQLGQVSGSATLTITETTPIYPLSTIPAWHSIVASCAICHSTGTGGAAQWPDSHSSYTTQMCDGCHLDDRP